VDVDSGVVVHGEKEPATTAATAYGDRAVGPIPRNCDLTFEVELLGIGK
jgi:FKBP-type peptidyl-prolyl cis-trans isomerase FkpA